MSLHLPRARLRPVNLPIRPANTLPQRNLFEWIRRRKEPSASKNLPPAPFDPQSADFEAKRAALRQQNQSESGPRQSGDLSASSIFDDPAERPDQDSEGATVPPAERDAQRRQRMQLDPYLSAPALDPNPRARRRWLQKQVARAVRNRGVISRDIVRKRTEREHLTRSEFLPTSIKKLMPLARQVRGQSVEEALVQLRFSKKAVAKDVMRILQVAREEAIISRGMGLGSATGTALLESTTPAVSSSAAATAAASSDADTEAAGAVGAKRAAPEGGDLALEQSRAEPTTVMKASPASAPKAPFEPVTIVDKKGKRRHISDPSSIYIAQAWVGRGPYGKVPEYRARGRMNILRPPYTSISFLLKEEWTRLREVRERETRASRRKPWVHHPDRPITRQRQHLMW